MIRRSTLVRVAAVCLPLAAAPLAFAQAPRSEPPPALTHLVGEEDAALLAQVQAVIDDWDPRKLFSPYVDEHRDEYGRLRKRLRRPDLGEFIADVEAAEALGKAFFWDMQAGSDFRRVPGGADGRGTFVGTACASCHYRFGADARDRNTTRIPRVAWDRYKIDPNHAELPENEPRLPFNPRDNAVKTIGLDDDSPLSLIVGSQGVEFRLFRGLDEDGPPADGGAWESEDFAQAPLLDDPNYQTPEWRMFLEGGKAFRQITFRNSPTVFNSGFSDRLFHDGRASSTFNGFSIFGDRDHREVLYNRRSNGELAHVRVAVSLAALASQAVGPVVNDVEMSYRGRTFHDLAKKLLNAPPLGRQAIAPDDSVLGPYLRKGLVGPWGTYRAMIRRAFRPEWWDGRDENGQERLVDLMLAPEPGPGGPPRPQGELMEANFSLYWGLSLLIYQAGLVSNQSPFDAMMRGDGLAANELWEQAGAARVGEIRLDRARKLLPAPPPPETPRPLVKNGAEAFQYGFRVFLSRGCVECHSGPLLSEVYERPEEVEPPPPIGEILDGILLPNAQADALAMALKPFHDETLAAVAGVVARGRPNLASQAARIARSLDYDRNQAAGGRSRLCALAHDRLLPQGVPEAEVQEVVELLHGFEKDAATHLGGRQFFDEAERVALAELLAGPAFVEKMPIPDDQARFRPRLPIAGPLAPENYAFYDLGFYNLGVAPPRYDRGIGGWGTVDPIDKLKLEVRARRIAERRVKDVGPPPGNEEEIARRIQDETAKEVSLAAEAAVEAGNAPGQAYQLRPEWRGPAAPAAEADPALCPDTFLLDHSWSRNHIPESIRRSAATFHSHARELAFNEEPWGRRKPLLHDDELAFWGSFKTPTLRNVELTAPYMHNGRLLTLERLIDFYAVGGHVRQTFRDDPDKHPAMVPLDLNPDDRKAILFFLMCLTDPRVRFERAPFDHPALVVVNGYQDESGEPAERLLTIGAVGTEGREAPPKPFPADE